MLARLYPAGSRIPADSAVEPFAWNSLRGGDAAGVRDTGGNSGPGRPTAGSFESAPLKKSFQAELDAMRNELDKARQQSESRTKEAYESGLEEGLRQVIARNQAEVEGFRKQIGASLHSLAQARAHVIERADEDLVRLGVAIAEKILNRQVQIDPDALRGLVSSALSKLNGKTVHCVRLHPDDQAVVQRELGLLGPRRSIRIEADSSLARGALVFDTDFGTFDASVTTQLEEVERGLVDRLRRSER